MERDHAHQGYCGRATGCRKGAHRYQDQYQQRMPPSARQSIVTTHRCPNASNVWVRTREEEGEEKKVKDKSIFKKQNHLITIIHLLLL